ncbi:tRNA uridine-5-carboxymethylaminomethyl(34) synthesis GTPase MnmE [Desulfatirhabdium butyrativorans]|uniref:tRNA uridine-5-carboxymethylaminomethyl(34) synthesis GTPase MnmE n=1 Tax=Desulfatirhabdium butyrativorans TaxID=340467 RepID=UPI0004070495|nr:tRNA uridine-5-carboxymethylaminomethyl(34) synthesis GTPase MnmE [Desulfatirhabdium butyrativorans]
MGHPDAVSTGIELHVDEDTIAAIATPAGRGGIGIVRISGPRAFGIIERIFIPSGTTFRQLFTGNGAKAALTPFRMVYGHITDTQTGSTVDEVLVVGMVSPHSYTREDVVEIHCHGGSGVMHHILGLVLQQGARLAEPGEFTKKAFLNGRIDLVQAEAVIDLVEAENAYAASVAAQALNGSLSAEIGKIRHRIESALAELDGMIDFPDEIPEWTDQERLNRLQTIGTIRREVQRLIQNARWYPRIRSGVSVTIAGKPNAGKSSLFNQLLKRDRAIVTPHPGTTRDILQEDLLYQGVRIQLCDTAGIHVTDDVIESVGIEKALDQCNASDILLLMIDATEPIPRIDDTLYEIIRQKPVIVVVNKIDLKADWDIASLGTIFEKRPIVSISAKTGLNIDRLLDELGRLIAQVYRPEDFPAIVPNQRQHFQLQELDETLLHVESGLVERYPPEMIAEELRQSIMQLQQITGDLHRIDTLDAIFERFCIGK